MALLFMDSFDHYATADVTEKWTQIITNGVDGGVSPPIGAYGRHGSNGVRFQTGGGGPAMWGSRVFEKTLPANGPIAVVGFAFRPTGAFTDLTEDTTYNPTYYNYSDFMLGLQYSGVGQVWLRVNNNGTISALRGTGSSTLLGTSLRALSTAIYVFIECKIYLDATVGTVEVRVNGETWLTVPPTNTRNTATVWTDLVIGGVRTTDQLHTWDYDDLYVLDGSGGAPWNDFLGDCRVDVRKPTGAGATTGWTPSVAPNWDNVNDAAPNDDTDYNSTTTVGATDTYATEDVAVAGATIYGVQVCVSHKKADAGPCSLAPVVRLSGGADVPGTPFNPGTTYAYTLIPYPSAPGSSGWTEAQFNGAEFGVKRTL